MEKFFMNGNNGISILIEGKQNEFKEYKDDDFINSISSFSTIRGNILSIAVSIENLINSNIEYILFDKQDRGSRLFRELFLESAYLGFGNKRKIYRELCKSSDKTKEIYKKHKSIITDINECIEIRNKFAHGQFLYKSDDNFFYLEFYSAKSHQTTQEQITTDNLEKLVNKFYQCINNINKLIGLDSTIKQKIK